MKKRKTNHFRLWAISVLAIFLLAAPSGWALDYDDGGTHDITIDEDYLNIGVTVPGTTVNLYANISGYIVVASGSFLNIYSGDVGSYIIAAAPSAVVTVYGTNFKVDNEPVPAGTEQFTPAIYVGSKLEGTYANGTEIYLWFMSDIPIYLQPPVAEEEDDELIIDVKPGSDENVINLKSRGVVPVAVLTTDEFDAGDLVPDYSISFAGASPVHGTLEDVDGDGDEDMLFHFRTQDLVELNEDSVEATLTATLKSAVTKSSATNGDVIYGTDKVKIKSSKKK